MGARPTVPILGVALVCGVVWAFVFPNPQDSRLLLGKVDLPRWQRHPSKALQPPYVPGMVSDWDWTTIFAVYGP